MITVGPRITKKSLSTCVGRKRLLNPRIVTPSVMRVEIGALRSQSRLIGAQQAFELRVFVISM